MSDLYLRELRALVTLQMSVFIALSGVSLGVHVSEGYAAPPKNVWSLTSDDFRRKPVTRFALGGVRIEAPVTAAYSAWGLSGVALGERIESDETSGDQITYDPDQASNYQARVGLNIDTIRLYYPFIFSAHYEQDFVSGFFAGGDADAQAIALPLAQRPERNVLRKAYARLTLGPFLTVSGGVMTSHWGLGLLANDGAHGWRPGSAYFGDPRGGDRVQRIMVSTGPWTRGDVVLLGAYDKALGDDILLNDDEARQIVLAAIYGFRKPTQIGAYAVMRTQDNIERGGVSATNRGKQTQVSVYDVYAKSRWKIAKRVKLLAEIEAVVISGETDLAPTPENPKHDVLHAALAARVQVKGRRAGGVLDFIYASGDQNFDDGVQNAFKADPNYELGLLMFRNVLAAQTGRAPVTAGDPNLVGQPNEDLDRFPTRGSVSNTIAIFPRGWIRLSDGVELYGGPLIAWGEVPLADPRNSRFNGGYPVNLLGSEGSNFLGTELDLGLRTTLGLWGGSTLELGAEGGVFFPGGAFANLSGGVMDPVYGGRLMAKAQF